MTRVKLTEAEREFLATLAKCTTTVTRRGLPGADRQSDKVRQSCRRNKWAQFGCWEGDRAMGWRITPAGRRAIEEGDGGANAPHKEPSDVTETPRTELDALVKRQ